MKYPIDVSMSGAVSLGGGLVCDGFLYNAQVRVQTHIHSDHMNDFSASKGTQEILMSEPTKKLLDFEFDADVPYRSNIKTLDDDVPYEFQKGTVTVLSSGHMLGCVQVKVILEDGMRLGYSSDFQWPIEDVIKVDGLVVDSTYGKPDSVRNYTQGRCEEALLNLVRRQLRSRPVLIYAHRGSLQRALQIFTGNLQCPVVGSTRVFDEARIYRDCGYTIGEIVRSDSEAGREIFQGNRYVRVYGTGDRLPADTRTASVIKLSAYFSKPDEPVTEYSDRAFGVALSNHADFSGTLEYIRATGAEFVVTDNTRGHGYELATEVKRRLGIEAVASSNFRSREWGQ